MAKSQSPRYVPNKALSNQKQAIYIGEQYFPMQNKLFKKFCDANLVITWHATHKQRHQFLKSQLNQI
jgi:hypothetical protein